MPPADCSSPANTSTVQQPHVYECSGGRVVGVHRNADVCVKSADMPSYQHWSRFMKWLDEKSWQNWRWVVFGSQVFISFLTLCFCFGMIGAYGSDTQKSYWPIVTIIIGCEWHGDGIASCYLWRWPAGFPCFTTRMCLTPTKEHATHGVHASAGGTNGTVFRCVHYSTFS